MPAEQTASHSFLSLTVLTFAWPKSIISHRVPICTVQTQKKTNQPHRKSEENKVQNVLTDLSSFSRQFQRILCRNLFQKNHPKTTESMGPAAESFYFPSRRSSESRRAASAAASSGGSPRHAGRDPETASPACPPPTSPRTPCEGTRSKPAEIQGRRMRLVGSERAWFYCVK